MPMPRIPNPERLIPHMGSIVPRTSKYGSLVPDSWYGNAASIRARRERLYMLGCVLLACLGAAAVLAWGAYHGELP